MLEKKKGVKNRRKNDIMTLCFFRVEETGHVLIRSIWCLMGTSNQGIQHIMENHTICLMFVYVSISIYIYTYIYRLVSWISELLTVCLILQSANREMSQDAITICTYVYIYIYDICISTCRSSKVASKKHQTTTKIHSNEIANPPLPQRSARFSTDLERWHLRRLKTLRSSWGWPLRDLQTRQVLVGCVSFSFGWYFLDVFNLNC